MFRGIKVVVGIVLALIIVAGIVFVGVPVVEERFVWVVVAQVNLSPGMRLGDGLVGLRRWDAGVAPNGAVHTLEGIQEMYALENITKGEPVLLSSLTAVVPPPVRTIPRQDHTILWFPVDPEDAANLFVGDVVDVTVSRPTGVSPLTVSKGWVVHNIDYEGGLPPGVPGVAVFLELKNEEFFTAFGYPKGHPRYETNPASPHIPPVRMVRSAPSRD